MVNSCRIFEEDSKAKSAHYKSISEKRGKQHQNRGKPYSVPAEKGKQKVADGKRPSEGGAPTNLKCFRCGEQDHCANECNGDVKKCF